MNEQRSAFNHALIRIVERVNMLRYDILKSVEIVTRFFKLIEAVKIEIC